MDRIYLDYNASTPVDPEVLEAMMPYFRNVYGNPSSIHWEGQQAKAALDRAREQVAALLGVEPREIVFTSGGTEADNLALQGIAYRYRDRGQHILVSAIEHPAVLRTAETLARAGFIVETIPVTADGIVDPDRVRAMIRPDTILVSVMAANNETGVIQPIDRIGPICREYGVFFHVDAVQGAGKMPLHPRAWAVDLMSLSGHKIYGPKGVGALYVRDGVEILPMIYGGNQERGRRSGTENLAGIVGMGAACAQMTRIWEEEQRRLRTLRDRFEQELRRRFPEVQIHGHRAARVGNTSMFSVPGMDGETLAMRLDLEGFAVSTGSACASGRVESSHVLEAMGVPHDVIRGALRISMGRYTRWEHLVQFLDTLARIQQEAVRWESDGKSAGET